MKILIFDDTTHIVAHQNIRSGGKPKLYGVTDIMEYSAPPYNISSKNKVRSHQWKLMVRRLKRKYKLK